MHRNPSMTVWYRRMRKVSISRLSFAVFAAVCSPLVFAQDESQDQQIEVEFQRVQVDGDKKAYVMPEISSAVPGSYKVGTTNITIERHDEMFKFSAVIGTTERVQWVSDTDKYGRFVFNEDKKKFERLTNSVRLEMEDYSKLDALVEDTEATSGKAFPELDFALIRLPKEVHPAEYVAVITNRSEVKTANVEVEEPRQIPL